MPLFDTLLEAIPAPSYDPDHPLQALVTNLDASPYLGRLALLRIRHGTLRKGAPIAWCRADGTIENARATELYVTEALDRVPDRRGGAGRDRRARGDRRRHDRRDDRRPRRSEALPVTTVDEPSLSVTIGINTSPLAGTEGTRLTASQIRERLDAELVGNVSLRVAPTSRPDAWEVQGRGELQLAILVELMRREGFELTVGKPEVLTKEIDGSRCEPVERVAIDVRRSQHVRAGHAVARSRGRTGLRAVDEYVVARHSHVVGRRRPGESRGRLSQGADRESGGNRRCRGIWARRRRRRHGRSCRDVPGAIYCGDSERVHCAARQATEDEPRRRRDSTWLPPSNSR